MCVTSQNSFFGMAKITALILPAKSEIIRFCRQCIVALGKVNLRFRNVQSDMRREKRMAFQQTGKRLNQTAG